MLRDSSNSAQKPENDGITPPLHPVRHPLVLWLLGNARWIWPLLVIAAIAALSWSSLRDIQYRDVRAALHNQDLYWLGLAFCLMVINLVVMGLYDVICLRDSRVRIMERWWVGALSFAWSNFLSLGPVAGPAIRFWLYRPAGVGFAILRQAILAITAGFSAGLVLWLAVEWAPFPGAGMVPFISRIIAAFILAYLLGMLAPKAQCWKRFPKWVQEVKVQWPILFILGVFDWLLAFLVFNAVLHAGGISIASDSIARLFFLGQGIGILSLIPGGLGSADAFWLAQLNSMVGWSAASLLVYRVVYYLLPWSAATLFLLRRAVNARARWAAPARMFASSLVLLSGCIILVSSATPALALRMRILQELLPLPVLEFSHLASALIGLLLFLLARGLMKGYRDAYRATTLLLLAGAAGSMLKGLDYEEAIILTLTALLLWAHSNLFTLPSRQGGTVIAILVPLCVGIFAFAAVGLSAYHGRGFVGFHWLTFSHFAYSARFVRTLGVLILFGLLIAIYYSMRIPHRYTAPGKEEIKRALEIHNEVGEGTDALMAVVGDKLIYFWENKGFCLYRTLGSYMIIFSDPSITAGMERWFMRNLLQQAAELDRNLVFYQISAHWIPVLHDFGYSFFKLGEDAIVDLHSFSIQGNKGKAMRNVLNRFRNDGYQFEVLPPERIPQRLPELREISDGWLRSKRTREKQFSIGYFDSEYLSSFPCALIRNKAGKAVAFANILRGPNNEECSVDLMRYLPECPNGVMDLLFLRLFEWCQGQGCQMFSLGMAPLATVGEARQAHFTERLANILFQHGEHWYNFRGLRTFKEKYNPRWIPRYLAYPAFWMAPPAIAHVAALISGGWRNVIFPITSRDKIA